MTEDQKEIRKLRKHLRDLTGHVDIWLKGIGNEMSKPSTVERGKTIAMICNHLNLQNDIAKRFGLARKSKTQQE